MKHRLPINPHSDHTLSRFVAARTMKVAAFLALALGAIVASKAIGYASLYSTQAARSALAATLSNNIGLSALFGAPHEIATVAGYTVWNTLASTMIVGSIWGFLTATKSLRGEEDLGRWEVVLAGRTTARRATVQVLTGLGASLLVLYVITAGVFIGVGRYHGIDYGVQPALFFALTAISGAVLFMAIGALASQLMPTRSRAASFSAILFGIFFLTRSMSNVTSIHWLLDLSPFGWIEKLQPLYGSQPLWLIPLFILIAVLIGLTVYLAGKRDLGDSTFADHDTARPRLGLLRGPLTVAIRLTRTISISWLFGISFIAVFFGLLTKTASQAFNGSHVRSDIVRVLHAPTTVIQSIFLGMIFFLLVPLLMSYVASAVGKIREDEAQGYLDNFLVRPISRYRWLWGRVLLIAIVIVLAGLFSGIGSWIGSASQHANVSFHDLILAGGNIIAPSILVLGICIFVFGFLPRYTTFAAYSLIAWSFLLQIVSSGLNLNHWFLDISILNHVALAPAVSPRWGTAAMLLFIGFCLALLGSYGFSRRDLKTD